MLLSLLFHAHIAACIRAWVCLGWSASRLRRRTLFRLPIYVAGMLCFGISQYFIYEYTRQKVRYASVREAWVRTCQNDRWCG